MKTVNANLVCIFSGQKYNTPITIDIESGAFASIELSDTQPPENASVDKEYVVYDEEIFHIQYDAEGNYFISPSELDDFKAHVMG